MTMTSPITADHMLLLQGIENQPGTELCALFSMAGFHIPGSIVQVTGKRSITNSSAQPWTPHAIKPSCQTMCACWCNRGSTSVGTNNCFPIGFKVHYAGSNHIWYCNPEQRSVIWNVKGPSREASSTALLNRWNMPRKWLSKHMCLCP